MIPHPYPQPVDAVKVGLAPLGTDDSNVLQLEQAVNNLVAQFNNAVQQLSQIKQRINEIQAEISALVIPVPFTGANNTGYIENYTLLHWPTDLFQIGVDLGGTNFPLLTIETGAEEENGNVTFGPQIEIVEIQGGILYMGTDNSVAIVHDSNNCLSLQSFQTGVNDGARPGPT